MIKPNNDEVICPKCCEQFRAIPVNVQHELETLRQRVAELEADNGLTIAYMAGFHDGKKDAQKQGDPVLYQCTKCGGANYGCQCATLTGCTEPLYAAPPTLEVSGCEAVRSNEMLGNRR